MRLSKFSDVLGNCIVNVIAALTATLDAAVQEETGS